MANTTPKHPSTEPKPFNAKTVGNVPDVTPANDFPAYQFGLTELSGEPRIRDLDLAERLGFDRPRKIRELIERNRAEVESFGTCPAVGRATRGNRVNEFYLNEEQALLVAVLSSTPRAPAVRAALIRTFVAYRRGQLGTASFTDAESRKVVGGIVKAVVHKEIADAIPALVDRLVEQRLEADPRVAVLNYRLPIDILIQARVPSRGRRGFSNTVRGRLVRYCVGRQLPMRRSPETDRQMFHVDAIDGWMQLEGRALIRDHIDKVTGQGHLKLVRAA